MRKEIVEVYSCQIRNEARFDVFKTEDGQWYKHENYESLPITESQADKLLNPYN